MALSQKQKRFLDKELKRIKKKNMNELRRWRKLRKKEIAKNKRKNKNNSWQVLLEMVGVAVVRPVIPAVAGHLHTYNF